MTTLLDRPDRSDQEATRPLILAGVAGAVWAAALGVLTVAVLVLVGWASAADSGSSASDAIRTSGQGWLLAHHTRMAIPGGILDFSPLGLIWIPGWLLYAAARRTARTHRPAGLRDAVRMAASLAVSYAVLCTVVSVISATGDVRPLPWSAFLCGLLLAAGAGGAGLLRGADLARGAKDRIPARLRAIFASGAAAVAVMIGTGALLFVVSLVMSVQRAADLARAFDSGPVGGLLLMLLGVALVPNAVLWASAFAIGPGFAIGAGTSVSPSGIKLGVVPSLPIFAGLPSPGPAPAMSVIAVLAPLVAGVVAGIVMVRRQRFSSPERAALWAGGAGAVAGAAMCVLTALAGGPVGGGRLAAVGPSPWQVGVFAAVEVGLFAAGTAWWYGRRRACHLRDQYRPSG